MVTAVLSAGSKTLWFDYRYVTPKLKVQGKMCRHGSLEQWWLHSLFGRSHNKYWGGSGNKCFKYQPVFEVILL